MTTPAQLLRARHVASGLYLDEKIKDYIVELVYATREPEKHKLGAHKHLIAYGASPRATIALAHAASRVLIDVIGVRQLGGLASELAKQTAEKAEKQQDVVLRDAQLLDIKRLYESPPLETQRAAAADEP